MFKKKNYIIVGLTTFHTEFLRISVPAVAKLKQDIYLIVHNDNTKTKVTKKQIRKLGYRGPLHIINNNINGGPLRARVNILAAIKKLNIKSDWMVFVDDDDLLINVDVPAVKSNHFAIMKNMIFVKKRLLDLLKIMDNPENYQVDDFHITVERPHIGIVGTMLRTDLMVQVGELIEKIIGAIYGIDATLGTRPPEDIVMWFYLQMYAKFQDPTAEAIYMDQTNYVATNLDYSPQKYGQNLIPDDMPSEYYEANMRKYCDLFADLLNEKENV